VDWTNTTLVKGDAAEELGKLKRHSDKDLFIFGSANLSTTFINHHLIDEYRLMVNPVILGSGGLLFQVNGDGLKFNLLRTQVFKNGNVLLTYQPVTTA
jgi:dihydrofolate reductase